jgi:hypothetical protein
MEVKMRYIFLLCSFISFCQQLIFCSENGRWQVEKPTVEFSNFQENNLNLNCNKIKLIKSQNKIKLKIITEKNETLLFNLGDITLTQLRTTTQQLYINKSFEEEKKLFVTVNKNGQHYRGELCVGAEEYNIIKPYGKKSAIALTEEELAEMLSIMEVDNMKYEEQRKYYMLFRGLTVVTVLASIFLLIKYYNIFTAKIL